MTRSPEAAKCAASHIVRLDSAAFAALYAGILVSGRKAFIDETLTMHAPGRPIMSRANTCAASRALKQLTSNTPRMADSSRSKKEGESPSGAKNSAPVVAAGRLPPAALMRMSAGPRRSRRARRAASREDLSVASQERAIAVPPSRAMSCATVSARSRPRASTATRAPHAASARAMHEPSTPLPPVTTAVFPQIGLKGISSHRLLNWDVPETLRLTGTVSAVAEASRDASLYADLVSCSRSISVVRVFPAAKRSISSAQCAPMRSRPLCVKPARWGERMQLGSVRRGFSGRSGS